MREWFVQFKYKNILKDFVIVILLLSNIFLIYKLAVNEDNVNSYYEALMQDISLELNEQIKSLEGFKQNPNSIVDVDYSFYSTGMVELSKQFDRVAKAMRSLTPNDFDVGCSPASATHEVAIALEHFRQVGFSSYTSSEKGFLIYIDRILNKLYEWQAIMEKELAPIDTMLEMIEVTDYSSGWSSNSDIVNLK